MSGRPAINMLGQRFGRLLVTERVAVQNRGRSDQARWRCACDCGSLIVVTGSALRTGRNKSCGCFRRDRAGDLYRKHGQSKTPAYTMFYDARKRSMALALPFDIEPCDITVPAWCPVLGIRLVVGGKRDNSPSLDRVRPELGYVKGNVRVISFRANRIKSDATADELRAVLSYVESACAF